MKTVFLYQGYPSPHPVHKAWAESVHATPIRFRIPSNKVLEKLDRYNTYLRLVRKRVSKFFFKHYPFGNEIKVVLSGGGACLPEALILKRRFNAKIILLAADLLCFLT